MPASNPRAITKARTLPCDVIILDLEDAVSPDHKLAARSDALAAIAEGGFGAKEVVLRINASNTPWGEDDLIAACSSGADAVLIPKIESADDIRHYDSLLRSAPKSLAMWAMIETCASVGALREIAACAQTTRLSLWVMGTNDLAKEMGAQLTPCRTPFLPFLSMAVAAARAQGLEILDGVCNEFRDMDALENEVRQGRMFGFDGKTLIHPAQIEACNRIFAPSDIELADAHAIIAAFEAPENQDKGVINLAGRMVERLHLDQARRQVMMAENIAKRGH